MTDLIRRRDGRPSVEGGDRSEYAERAGGGGPLNVKTRSVSLLKFRSGTE